LAVLPTPEWNNSQVIQLKSQGFSNGISLALCHLAMRHISTEARRKMAQKSVSQLGRSYVEAQFVLTPITALSTGIPELDAALGIGGLPCGMVCELFGPESSGKTTVALSAVAQVQRSGGVAAYLDIEHRLESKRAEMLGVNVSELMVYRPRTAEQAFDIVAALLCSEQVDLVVLDSIAALVPKREFDAVVDWEPDANWGGLIARAIRKLAGLAARSNTSLLLLNQIRQNVSVVFGRPETTPGGRAIRHHASVRIELRRITAIKQKDLVVGSTVKATIIKNSLGAAYSVAEFAIRDIDAPVNEQTQSSHLAACNGQSYQTFEAGAASRVLPLQ
jgi:recombination protein RecA